MFLKAEHLKGNLNGMVAFSLTLQYLRLRLMGRDGLDPIQYDFRRSIQIEETLPIFFANPFSQEFITCFS